VPEGDTIYRAASRLREALEGRRITRVRSFFAAIEDAELDGRVLDRIETRGKHLFLHFDDGRTLHVHLGMRGVWRIYPNANTLRSSGPARRLVLETAESVAVCWNAPVVELVRGRTLAAHPVVGKLGPDLLAADFDVAQALGRFREHGRRPVGEVLMDQRVMAGVGNVFKSEVLFLCQISPFLPAGALDDASLERLITTARRELRRSAASGRRATRRAVDGPRDWVYKRSGELCLRCGTRVRMEHQGAPPRSTYFCPACQGVE
jgi:endonuclease VIII